MSAESQTRISVEDYLATERRSETRSEYLHGEVFARPRGSRRHNLIVWNLASSLHRQLQGKPCEAYVGDLRVHIETSGLYTYPDLVVACGEPRFEDGELDTLLNPTLLIEVLSPSTEGYGRGKKAAHDRSLASLRESLLVSQEEIRVELLTRQAEGHWLLAEATRLEDSVPLASIGCALRLAEVYERVAGLPGGLP